MVTEIKMPKMGLTMTTGTVAEWLKKEGDTVKKGEEILEITTEKITNVVDAPADGILLKIVAPVGTELPIGGLLGMIGEAGENIDVSVKGNQEQETKPAAKAETSKEPVTDRSTKATGKRIKITPAAAKLARSLGVDYTNITGAGPGGRITKEDVEKAAAQATATQTERAANKETETFEEAASYDLVPYSGIRKAIGDNMSRSWTAAPRVTHHVSVDVSRLLDIRKTINEDANDTGKVSITDLLVKIVAKSLEMKPNLNISLDGNTIKIFKDIHIGIAVALKNGLVVPVIKNANKKSLFRISGEIKELTKKARENRLSMDEVSNGTFTLTNLGAYGSVDFFTPIINHPQSAILGVGRIVKMPAVVNGQIVPRPMIGLSLAYDHRVIDGASAAEFMAVLIKLLEKPITAVL